MTAPEVAPVQDELGPEPPRYGNCGDHVAINPDYADWHRKRADRAECKVAELQKDAERYRWLIDALGYGRVVNTCHGPLIEYKCTFYNPERESLEHCIAAFLDRSKS